MNTRLITGIIIGLTTFGLSESSRAAHLYQITLNGFCWATNTQGTFVKRPLNNTTVLRNLARREGITNYTSWMLAYHVGGSELGDTIEVIDRGTGTTLKVLYGFYFGTAFGRLTLNSGSGLQQKRIDYVYTEENSHSLGSALLSRTFVTNSQGNTNKVITTGQMQWLNLPDPKSPQTEVCTATIATGRALNFTSAP